MSPSADENPAASNPTDRSVHWCRKLINLFNVLRYAAVLAATLFILPFSAYEWTGPLYTYVGGLMIGFENYHLFWMAAVFCATAWALMLCTGLLVDGYKERIAANPTLTGARQLPRWAQNYLTVPGPNVTFWVFTLVFALPGIIIAIIEIPGGDGSMPKAAAFALLGILFAFTVMVLASTLVSYADEKYVVVNMPLAHGIRRWIPQWIAAPIAKFVGEFFSWLPRRLGVFHHMLKPVEDGNKHVLKSDHLFAITNVLMVVIVYVFIAWIYYPFHTTKVPANPPALAYFYMLLFLLIWTLTAIDYHFSRWQISPLLVITLWMAFIYTVFQSGLARKTDLAIDHHFEVIPRESSAKSIEPVAVAATPGSDTLVVVTATGGGIWASGWFSASLQHLIQDHGLRYPDIRMLSTVSGGSVGAAQFIRARLAHLERGGPPESDVWLADAFTNSVDSSLTAATYAFSSYDFWTTAFGGFAFWARNHDRGLMIERKWAQIGAKPPGQKSGPWRVGDSTTPSVLQLVPWIQKGEIPAPIFNCTVMETGRRIMTSPMHFEDRRGIVRDSSATDSWLSPESARAQTLFELLSTPTVEKPHLNLPEPDQLDIGMWSAARLSATFSYVSPAARARNLKEREMGGPVNTETDLREFHLIDGGYYDNYGVASALDFLTPVMKDRNRADSKLTFNKALIIQLRSSKAFPPSDNTPSSGFGAAVFGPLMGLANNRDASAVTRNQEALLAFIDRWNDVPDRKAELATVVFEYPLKDAPLSWHLTRDQKDALQNPWRYLNNEELPVAQKELLQTNISMMSSNLTLMKAFLAKPAGN